MDVLNTKLTVYFENPFWVGIIEKMMKLAYQFVN